MDDDDLEPAKHTFRIYTFSKNIEVNREELQITNSLYLHQLLWRRRRRRQKLYLPPLTIDNAFDSDVGMTVDNWDSHINVPLPQSIQIYREHVEYLHMEDPLAPPIRTV